MLLQILCVCNLTMKSASAQPYDPPFTRAHFKGHLVLLTGSTAGLAWVGSLEHQPTPPAILNLTMLLVGTSILDGWQRHQQPHAWLMFALAVAALMLWIPLGGSTSQLLFPLGAGGLLASQLLNLGQLRRPQPKHS